LRRCEFSGNRSAGDGGGIIYAVSQGRLLIEDCLFDWNEAQLGAGVCLAVHPPDGKATINNSTFSFNTAIDGEGAAIWGNGPLQLQIFQCVFMHNRATKSDLNNEDDWKRGGAISVRDETPKVPQGRLFLLNSTFFGNYVWGWGADLWMDNNGTAPTIVNTIFSGCTVEGKGFVDVQVIFVKMSLPVVGFDVQFERNDKSVVMQNVAIKPKNETWVDLTKFDLATKKQIPINLLWSAVGLWRIDDPGFVDSKIDDLRLESDSCLIDKGLTYIDIDPLDGTVFTPLPPTDFAGQPRVVDGNGDRIAQVDIGAYEYQGQ